MKHTLDSILSVIAPGKKITLAQVKKFVRLAQENGVLLVKHLSRFDGMIDGVSHEKNPEWSPARTSDRGHTDHDLGVGGLWLVGGSRDSFTRIEKDGVVGIHVYNSCGSCDIGVRLDPAVGVIEPVPATATGSPKALAALREILAPVHPLTIDNGGGEKAIERAKVIRRFEKPDMSHLRDMQFPGKARLYKRAIAAERAQGVEPGDCLSVSYVATDSTRGAHIFAVTGTQHGKLAQAVYMSWYQLSSFVL